MQTYLLVISFLLHGLTIFWIIVLSQRVQKNKELELRQEKVAKEIEDLFTTYLLEIKEENERLTQLMEGNAVSNPTNSYSQNLDNKNNKHNRDTDPNNSFPALDSNLHDIVEESLSAKVYHLYDQGYSIEEIAKKLDRGKTEIELLVKFHPIKS